MVVFPAPFGPRKAVHLAGAHRQIQMIEGLVVPKSLTSPDATTASPSRADPGELRTSATTSEHSYRHRAPASAESPCTARGPFDIPARFAQAPALNATRWGTTPSWTEPSARSAHISWPMPDVQ